MVGGGGVECGPCHAVSPCDLMHDKKAMSRPAGPFELIKGKKNADFAIVLIGAGRIGAT